MLNFGLSTRPAVDSIKAEYTHQAWEEIGWMEAREETMAERIAVVGWSRFRAPDGKVVSLAQECGISNQRVVSCALETMRPIRLDAECWNDRYGPHYDISWTLAYTYLARLESKKEAWIASWGK